MNVLRLGKVENVKYCRNKDDQKVKTPGLMFRYLDRVSRFNRSSQYTVVSGPIWINLVANIKLTFFFTISLK